MEDHLKKCTICDKCWDDIYELLKDTDIILDGYIPFPQNPNEGNFLFTHGKENCRTTFAIKVKNFIPLMQNNELAISPFIPGEDEHCKGYCLDDKNLQQCNNQDCNGSLIRDLIHIIRKKLAY